MGASSSIGTFSFLQGGVLYHQAPPIQTQAQIGDGLHIISAPSQATVDNVNISMNSHSQPPPQMIITQVQIEPNNQIVSQGGGEQITHTFQQPAVSQQQKTQFHLIGHMQGAISQDQTTMQQQSQSIIQQQTREIQNVDNFSHFSIGSQTSTPSSLVFTLPYHMTVSANTSCTTTIPMSQSQIHHVTGPPNQNIQIHQSEQEHILKQLPRQIMHTGFLPPQQRQTRNDRGTISVQIPSNQIQTSQPPNAQSTLEHIIFTQPPNTQAIINQIPHVPSNQLITTQMPPTNTFLTNQQANQHLQNTLMGNQSNSVMVPQQELNQLTNISQQLSQLPPIPPNQPQQSQLSMTPITTNQLPPTQILPTHLPPNQILSQDQHNQQQINMQQSLQSQIQRQQSNHQQFNQVFEHSAVRQESRMHDIQGRSRAIQVDRIRKQSRNNRQDSYPWNKNDVDKSNPNWGKRDVDRNFDYDEYSSDGRLRYQQTSNNQDIDREQYENEKNKTNVNIPAGNQRYQQYDKNDNQSHDSSVSILYVYVFFTLFISKIIL